MDGAMICLLFAKESVPETRRLDARLQPADLLGAEAKQLKAKPRTLLDNPSLTIPPSPEEFLCFTNRMTLNSS
jgi:hypothetical protein